MPKRCFLHYFKRKLIIDVQKINRISRLFSLLKARVRVSVCLTIMVVMMMMMQSSLLLCLLLLLLLLYTDDNLTRNFDIKK